MSRLFIDAEQEKKLKGLLTTLKRNRKPPKKGTVEIKDVSLQELVALAEQLLLEKPVVVEVDPSPSEAGEIAQVSRPFIIHLLKEGTLKGYQVGTHWRIKRDSLLQYLADRENISEAIGLLDKDGFGLD